jgi:hypothetical protein
LYESPAWSSAGLPFRAVAVEWPDRAPSNYHFLKKSIDFTS